MKMKATISVPYGVAEIRDGRYRFRKDVLSWVAKNLKGKWRVHRKGDPNDCTARFSINRPVTAEASFAKDTDAVLFKMFWGEEG
jgi:hypothetical protein